MTEDVSAGRLHIDAYAETRGVTRGLQSRLDAEMARANIRAKVKVSIDTRGIVGEAKAAAAAASKAAQANVRIKVRMAVDRTGLAAEVRAAAKEASEAAQINARMALDQGSAAATAAQIAAVARDRTSTVEVDADTAAASAQIAAAKAKAEEPIKIKADTSSLTSMGRAMTQASKIPMLVGGFYTLGSAIVQVAGGLTAMASSAISAAGAVAAIPNALGMAGQAIGVLLGGFSGIGEAVTQLGAVEQQTAQQSGAAAQARQAAADRVRGAQQALAGALRAAEDQARTSAEAVSDAQWSLARSGEAVVAAREALRDAHYQAGQSAADAAEQIKDAEEAAAAAQRTVAQAQRDLNEARRDARERIDDMNEALRLSRMDEESAMAALVRAREDLQDVKWNTAASPQERRDAEMAVKEAERQLERIKSGNKELAEDVRQANKEGVKGSDEVRSAQQNLTSAQEQQRESIEAVTEARENARRVAIENARSIRDAEYGVRDALHEQGEAREALSEAERAQAQGAQDAAQAIADAQRELRRAQQDATLAATEQTAAQLALTQAMDNLSPAGRRFAKFLSDVLLPRLHRMKLAIQEALLPGIQLGIRRAMPLLDTLQTGLVDTAQRIGRFAASLGRLFGRETFNNHVAQIMKSNNRALTDFLFALKPAIRMFKNLALVAGPELLEPFAKWTRALFESGRKAAKTNRQNGDMAETFENIRKRVVLLKDIFKNLGVALYNIGKAANPTGDSLLGTFERVTRRWADFAKSDLGQERMKQFFEAVAPTTRAVGRLVASLAELVIKLSESGSGPAVVFLDALTAMADGIIWLVDNVPGFGKFVSWFMLLAGVGGAVGFVTGSIMKMVGNIGKLLPLFKVLGPIFGAFGKAAIWIGTKALPLLIRLLPILGRVVMFAFGPWGAIIAGVIALFVLLYNKVGWFRAGVQAVMKAIVGAFWWVVDAAKALWDKLFGHSYITDIMKGIEGFWGLVKRIFRFIADAFQWIGKAAKWLWNNAIKPTFKVFSAGVKLLGRVIKDLWRKYVSPAMTAIGDKVREVWKKYVSPTFKVFNAGLKLVGNFFKDLWKKYVSPFMTSIGDKVENVWRNYIKPTFKVLNAAIKGVGDFFKDLWKRYVDPLMSSVGEKIRNVWKDWIKPAFDAVADMVKKTVPNAFKDGVKAIKDFWDGLRSAAMRPVKFVVDTVWNNGLRKVINAIPGVSDMDPISTSGWAKGTANVLPGYTPGRDVHSFVSPTAGRLNLSGGEAIMRPEWTRMVGAKGVDMMNKAARMGRTALARVLGGERFAQGGIWHPGTRTTDTADTLSQAWDINSVGGTGTPVRSFLDGVVSRAVRQLTSYGNYAMINHPAAGLQTLYAHMSELYVNAGDRVKRGEMIGREGSVGNSSGPHLHFEIGGGSSAIAAAGSGSTSGGPSAAVLQAREDKSSWRDRLSTIMKVIRSVPSWIGRIRDSMGPWGEKILTGVREMGSKVVQWANDKIPDKFGPLPFPDNPIPNVFDDGGSWRSGTLGMNLSGSTETVFTNSDMVDLAGSLRNTAVTLRSLIVDGTGGSGGGLAPLVGELTLMGRPEDMPNLLADANLELRRIRRGGVHASRTARAPARTQ